MSDGHHNGHSLNGSSAATSEAPSLRVREVISAGGIKVVFQPLVELESLEIYAYETLVRAQGYKTPLDLVAAAVEEKCMGELGREIRRLAVAGCPDHPLFVNIDPHEFDQEWLVRADDPIFSHAHDVHLEITESVPLTTHHHYSGVLAEVRRRGARLAVDDLGAGYSNLKYIADLAPEIVKLDRELVKDLDKDERGQILVHAIVFLCERLGAKVVAEGVETVEELEAVRRAGVHFAQGYYLARPANPLPKVNPAVREARIAARA